MANKKENTELSSPPVGGDRGILMTGGGAPGAAGILKCLQQVKSLHITATDASPNAVGRYINKDFEHIPFANDPSFTDVMLDICRNILSPKALGLVLTAYSIRASFYSIHELMRETMRGAGGVVESGELVIREAGIDGKTQGRALSTSLFSRWVPQ